MSFALIIFFWCTFGQNILSSFYFRGDVCPEDDKNQFFNFSSVSPQGFITSTSFGSSCIGSNCTYTISDTCEYWGVNGNTLEWKNFTDPKQDANDPEAWKKRSLCMVSPVESKTYKNGECIGDELLDYQTANKVRIMPKKKCVVTEGTYKNSQCQGSSFPARLEFDVNVCEVHMYSPRTPDYEGGFISMIIQVSDDMKTAYVQQFSDPFCVNKTAEITSVVGKCVIDDDDDDDDKFSTYTKVSSITCESNVDTTSDFKSKSKSSSVIKKLFKR